MNSKMWNEKSKDYQILNLSYPKDKSIVKTFLLANQNYLIWQDGLPISERYVKDFFYGELPPTHSYQDKQIIGVFHQQKLVCVFDILHHYPILNTWVIGLMLLEEKSRAKGLGAYLFQCLEKHLIKQSQNSILKLRLGVLEDNEIGLRFWQKMGFIPTGKSKPQSEDKPNRMVLVYEKKMP